METKDTYIEDLGIVNIKNSSDEEIEKGILSLCDSDSEKDIENELNNYGPYIVCKIERIVKVQTPSKITVKDIEKTPINEGKGGNIK